MMTFIILHIEGSSINEKEMVIHRNVYGVSSINDGSIGTGGGGEYAVASG
ncbi:protein of unknown function [Paenibacillus alvei]|uniref:Uncharacterized protein n=1 Tax=Paenibacillus alvei TaxID=44250 RepID=A0A383RKN7_PAEAL|nr:protein of unknown function [Paenibacillus alvei]